MSKRKRRKKVVRRRVKATNSPIRVQDQQGIPATAETKRNRKYCQLGRLYRSQKITWGQLAAAERIRKAVECITMDVRYHPPSYEDQGRIPRKSGPRPTGYSGAFETELQMNYVAWLSEMDRLNMQTKPILECILDEMPIRVMESKWQIRQGTGLMHLIESLDIYIKLNVRFQDVVAA